MEPATKTAVGSLVVGARELVTTAQTITVWSRGLAVSFVDAAPLAEVFDASPDVTGLRQSLIQRSNSSAAAATDLALLEEAVRARDADPTGWRLRLLLEHMRARNLTDFGVLPELYQSQRQAVALLAADTAPLPSLAALLLRPQPVAPTGDLAALNRLTSEGVLKPVLRFTLAPQESGRTIAYVVRVPPMARKASAELFVAAGASEPERLAIAGEAVEVPGWFSSTLVTTLMGALLGYLVFVQQQRFLRMSESRREFERKKIELSAKLHDFCQNVFPTLMAAADKTELEKATSVKRVMIADGIYAITPPSEIRRLNRICDPRLNFPESRDVLLQRWVARNFREFVA